MPLSDFIDHPITVCVRDVLEADGFTVRSLELEEAGAAVMAAEDDYSLAAIVAADRWDEIQSRVATLDIALGNWVARSDAGGKQWDVYLLCLVQERLKTQDEFAEAEASEADTRRVRKYVRDGVLPEYDEVRSALSPLLSLELPVRSQPSRPLEMLEAKLRERGIDADAALLALEGFARASAGEEPR